MKLPPLRPRLVPRPRLPVVLHMDDERPALARPREQPRRPLHEPFRLGHRPVAPDRVGLDVHNDQCLHGKYAIAHTAIMSAGTGPLHVFMLSAYGPRVRPQYPCFMKRNE